jgi:hypothetical protein
MALYSLANFLCICNVSFFFFQFAVRIGTFIFVIYFFISFSLVGTHSGNNRCIRCFNGTSLASPTLAESTETSTLEESVLSLEPLHEDEVVHEDEVLPDDPLVQL